jgi:small GTP-binding protein
MHVPSPGGSRKEKVVMIGQAGCGKTAITNRIIQNTFKEGSSATVGASFAAKQIPYNGISLRLDIWDTGGSEKFRALAPMYYRDARAAVVVFDLTDANSLVHAQTWVEELRRNGRSDVVLIGAGNKLDLDLARVLHGPQIDSFRFEQQLDYCVEVSAKTGAGIDALFGSICEGVMRLPPLESPDSQILEEYITGTPADNKCEC